RRTRQFGPPRALGGLGPAVHDIRRHHTLSHTTRTARRKLERRLLSHHSYLCRGATRQELMNLRPNFAANCCIAITGPGIVQRSYYVGSETIHVQPSRPFEPALPS